MILSREHYDPADITVSLPIEAPYQAGLWEETVQYDRTQYYREMQFGGYETLIPSRQLDTDFPLWIYQTYRGLNWETLPETWDSGMGIPDAYGEDYMALKREDLPEFYLYSCEVLIGLDETGNTMALSKDETIHTLDIQMGEERYTVDVGEIRIHAEPLIDESGYWPDGIFGFYSGAAISTDSDFYGPGYVTANLGHYGVEKDITLTGFSLMEEIEGTAELVETKVYLSDNESEYGMEILWDGESPIPVQAGQYYTVEVVIHDSRMDGLCYGGRIYPQLTFRYQGESYTQAEGISLTRENNEPWVWYAGGLDGLDIAPYYHDYYYVYENTHWRDYFQEAI